MKIAKILSFIIVTTFIMITIGESYESDLIPVPDVDNQIVIADDVRYDQEYYSELMYNEGYYLKSLKNVAGDFAEFGSTPFTLNVQLGYSSKATLLNILTAPAVLVYKVLKLGAKVGLHLTGAEQQPIAYDDTPLWQRVLRSWIPPVVG